HFNGKRAASAGRNGVIRGNLLDSAGGPYLYALQIKASDQICLPSNLHIRTAVEIGSDKLGNLR
ncbi:hypothetical protein NPIL_276571, partial [Nephila pilipes]